MQAAEKEAANRQKEVDKAADHIAKLTERVRKAEAGQAEAQNKLASAGVEASSARKLVEAVCLWRLPCLHSSRKACMAWYKLRTPVLQCQLQVVVYLIAPVSA